MRIERVDTQLVGTSTVGSNLIVSVTTDTGLVGIGQSGAWGFADAVERIIAQFREHLVGRDPFAIEHINQSL